MSSAVSSGDIALVAACATALAHANRWSQLESLVDAAATAVAEAARSRRERVDACTLRGIARRLEMMELEGGCVTATRISSRVRLTRSAIRRRLTCGDLIALHDGRGRLLFPAWQAYRGGLLPRLGDIIRLIAPVGSRSRSATRVMRFMLAKNPLLAQQRPLDLLRRGEAEEAIEAASTYGEMGA